MATWTGWLETLSGEPIRRSVGRGKSIICLGVNYGPTQDALAVREEPDCGGISVYARGRDYHDVLKKRLKGSPGG